MDKIQVKYVNTLLYPVSVRDCPSPEHGLLGVSIGELNSKTAL